MDIEDQIKSYKSYLNETQMEEEELLGMNKRRRLRKLDEEVKSS